LVMSLDVKSHPVPTQGELEVGETTFRPSERRSQDGGGLRAMHDCIAMQEFPPPPPNEDSIKSDSRRI
jgi:hypothetical protein